MHVKKKANRKALRYSQNCVKNRIVRSIFEYIYIFLEFIALMSIGFSLCMDGPVMCDRPIRSRIT